MLHNNKSSLKKPKINLLYYILYLIFCIFIYSFLFVVIAVVIALIFNIEYGEEENIVFDISVIALILFLTYISVKKFEIKKPYLSSIKSDLKHHLLKVKFKLNSKKELIIKTITRFFLKIKKIITYIFKFILIWCLLIFSASILIFLIRTFITKISDEFAGVIVIILTIATFFLNKRIKKTFSIIKFFLVYVLLIILYLFLSNSGLFPMFKEVKGKSMLPTLQVGEYLLCDKYDKKNHNLNYRDIVVFKYQKKDQQKIKHAEYIKRIVALPNDKVMIKDDELFINGNLQYEEYVNEFKSTNNWENGFTKEGEEIIVPENKYFLLGDNRRHSSDSREFGFISEDDIICFISWEKQEKYKKRWRSIIYLENKKITPTIEENNNTPINYNIPNVNQKPIVVDLDYVRRRLKNMSAVKDSWEKINKIPEEERKNLVNSMNILIDFCTTLLSRLDETKTPTQDDIYMYNSIRKLAGEISDEMKRLADKYSLTIRKIQ